MSVINPVALTFARDALTCSLKLYFPRFEFNSGFEGFEGHDPPSRFSESIRILFMTMLEERRSTIHEIYSNICGSQSMDIVRFHDLNNHFSEHFYRKKDIFTFFKYCVDMCECSSLCYGNGFYRAPTEALKFLCANLQLLKVENELDVLEQIARQRL